TYSGGTKISAGTLSIGSDANLGTGSGTNTLAGGTLDLNAAATYAKNWTVEADSAINAGVDATISGVLSGPGGIEKTGSGKLTLTGTNAYGGATKVSAGTLVGNIAADTDLAVYSGATYDSGGAARSIDALTGAGNVIIDNTLTVQKGDFDGVITGTGGLAKIGTGTLSLWNANNDYTGATTVSEGMLIGGIAEGTDLHVAFGATYKGTGAERTIGELTGAGTVSGAGSLSINRGSFSGTFGDTGTVIKIGAETLILSGNNNSFEGNITVSAGTLSIRSDDNIGMGTNTLAGGTLDLAEAGTYAKAWTVSADSVINADVDATLEGALDGEGGIEKTGSGTLTLTGDNTYAGVTKVSEGILQIGDGGETGSIAGNIVNNANVTFNRSDDLAYGHAISGSGGLTKRGSGTLALSGANTYSGMTTVEAGKLQLASGGAISNQLTLRGGAEFDSGGASVPLARLDVYGGAKPAIYTGNLVAGEVMNFYVPATMASGGTLLAVDGTVLLANPTVNVGVDGAATPLQAGDHIVLVESNASLGGTRANSVARGTGMQGVTLDLAFDLAQTETQLLATLSAPPTVNPDAKNLSEGYLAGPALLSQGTDFLLSRGRDAMRDAASAWRPEIFATAGGWKIRHRTGSSVDVRGRTLVAGLAAGGESGVGRLAGAIFLEYGSGDYDSHNSHAGYRIKGSGDTSHLGAGLLAELAIPGGFNLDASLRAGSVKTDYRSDDLRDQSGVRAEYGAKSAYLGAHLGVGKAFDLSAAIRIEPYLRGIWTRQGRDATQLSTGERLEFDATASKRLRLGLRASRAFTPAITARVDLAVDREFSGEARARTNGHAIEAPRLRGTTGVGEIGLTATPRPGKPFQIDVGIQGYAGRRTGVSGGVTARYFF
ncbi:MAG: autotransporter-associated beta strand repeat-containing protein, partial [Planctomycetota bacterium]|nr:autotransporter-associated beta strand repeat-containing protein [Planctomycetota bacterium]